MSWDCVGYTSLNSMLIEQIHSYSKPLQMGPFTVANGFGWDFLPTALGIWKQPYHWEQYNWKAFLNTFNIWCTLTILLVKPVTVSSICLIFLSSWDLQQRARMWSSCWSQTQSYWMATFNLWDLFLLTMTSFLSCCPSEENTSFSFSAEYESLLQGFHCQNLYLGLSMLPL